MPTTAKLRSRLIKKLKELFQLDQPDLDFGFYRIMHAKSEQVIRFLDKDLLNVITDEFGKVDDSRKTKLKAKYEAELKAAKDYGVENPEKSPKVKDARKEYQAVQDTASVEGEIYDHLYRFFERYYDNGDFISLRYHTRETPGKAASFAVPYNGEEVKLHWANADQYYIKTTEHFNNFTVDLSQAKEVREHVKTGQSALDVGGDKPCLVHFRIVDATEGEHGNVKATEVTKRYFIIHKEQPVLLDESGDLVIQFEYRPDPEKSGQGNTWRDKRNAQAVQTVFTALNNLADASKYKQSLAVLSPTDNDAMRPLLAKYINQYSARNTMDYFIHKDLGVFFRRELDFYIKNEIMHLDDIQDAEAPEVEAYLSKIKVLRTIAHKLIDFLAQLEDFQKHLWLKKKFIIETNYCITLDRVPEELYPEVAANEAQREEWVQLFSIDDIKEAKSISGYSKPLSIEFLKENIDLVLDTHFFEDDFKSKLAESIENFDDQCDGLLIHSENFQALRFLQNRYREQVKYVYIDPPYNTGGDGFSYKDSYQHSSWMSLMQDRAWLARSLLNVSGVFSFSIDEIEVAKAWELFKMIFGEENFATDFIWEKKKKPSFLHRNVGKLNDYILSFVKDYRHTFPFSVETTTEEKKTPLNNAGNSISILRFPALSVRFNIEDCTISSQDMSEKNIKTRLINELTIKNGRNQNEFYLEGEWRYSQAKLDEVIEAGEDLFISKIPFRPNHIKRGGKAKKMKNMFSPEHYEMETNEDASEQIQNLFGYDIFKNPKPEKLIRYLIKGMTYNDLDSQVLDYFSGSGVTGSAVINLNREDSGKRKYILVEMDKYFDTVLKPRITKTIYSNDWKDGNPKNRSISTSHCVKYIRLESYEDCLNNLIITESEARDRTLEKSKNLHEDYMLHYMLDVETRGSQSLLNINEFIDPTAYKLRVKKPGSDQYTTRNVDLMETFNYLIGLRVTRIAAPQTFKASFQREKDPELPKDNQTRLTLKGRFVEDAKGPWWFRKVEGWVPADPNHPNSGEQRQILIIWRKLTSNLEEDNLMLNEWFKHNRAATKPFKYDTIYTNGSNNLPSLKRKGDTWSVRLIEEDFMRLMWDVEDV